MIGANILVPSGLALAGILTGLSWKLAVVGRWDEGLALRVYQAAWAEPADSTLALFRHLGTTPFFVLALLVVALVHPAWTVGLAGAAVAAEAVCKLLKVLLRRPRPFAQEARIVPRLPRLPIDPSYPSADAMRAAFLSGLMVAGEAPWWAVLTAIGVAVVIGAGRVRAGAHYPLDVWAGLLIGFGAVFAWVGTL